MLVADEIINASHLDEEEQVDPTHTSRRQRRQHRLPLSLSISLSFGIMPFGMLGAMTMSYGAITRRHGAHMIHVYVYADAYVCLCIHIRMPMPMRMLMLMPKYAYICGCLRTRMPRQNNAVLKQAVLMPRSLFMLPKLSMPVIMPIHQCQQARRHARERPGVRHAKGPASGTRKGTFTRMHR